MVVLNFIIIIFVGYLLGSLPTAIITGKVLRGIDIREHGSGNAGGTNVFRVLGWKPGIAVILIDIVKGLVATVFVAKLRLIDLPIEHVYVQLLAGISAIAGHIWTVFAGFRGGKGVGTVAGMMFGLLPVAASICLIIFFIVVFSTRYVSLASMAAAISLPIVITGLSQLFGRTTPQPLFILSLFLAVLIIYTHRSNVKRLLNGTENRFGEKRMATDQSK